MSASEHTLRDTALEYLHSWFGFKPPLMWLLQRILMSWVKYTVSPEDIAELSLDPNLPICYVLDLDGVSNSLVLREVCHELGLPDSGGHLRGFDVSVPATVFLRSLRGFMVRRADPRMSTDLNQILTTFDAQEHGDIQFVPVSIFWGRAPDKEESVVKLLFSDTWSIAGRIRKMMIILLHGRNTFVQFSRPISLTKLQRQTPVAKLVGRKLSRIIRVHFRRLRVAAIGPDLSHKRLLVEEIIASDSVRRAIDIEVKETGITHEKATAKARKYANEIAADYSHAVIRVLETVMTWLWNSLYHGIKVNNFGVIKEVAPGNEVIYVPCHRSHADYLLLSYVLYKRGLVPPHIAAGINLNLPVLGSFLRRGGAFFLRRSFKGIKLYATVFDAYLRRNLSKGVSIEYFVEGTRSRTGKLLDAKAGMLSMTVRSYLVDQARPVVFVPVYFGYERLLEGSSYAGELSGAAKKKETIWGLLKSLGLLRKNYGQVYVNFSDPIHLDQIIDGVADNWREECARNQSVDQVNKLVVPNLGRLILTSINCSAAVNPVNLLALVLQASDQHSLLETDLSKQLDFYAVLLQRLPYSPTVTIDALISEPHAGENVIRYGEEFGLLERHQHALGDVIGLDAEQGRMINYYNNNVKHLFAVPSLIACSFMVNRSLARDELKHFIKAMYSLARGEYFLRWEMHEVDEVIDDAIAGLVELGLIESQGESNNLRRPRSGTKEIRKLDLLAHIYFQTLERYSVIISLILEGHSGEFRQADLEVKSRLAAERMLMLKEAKHNEQFDRRAFRRIMSSLLASKCIWRDDQRNLCYGDTLHGIGEILKSTVDVPVSRVSLHN